MCSKACLLFFYSLADREPALALCEIAQSGKYDVATVGFSERPVTAMGVCRVISKTLTGRPRLWFTSAPNRGDRLCGMTLDQKRFITDKPSCLLF